VAVVEFAPYQKVMPPREGRRRDPKINTLDQDPDYLRFLEFLAAGPEVGWVLIIIKCSVFRAWVRYRYWFSTYRYP